MAHHISVTIITYNEEKRIEACLRSLKDIADEIIVVDSFSDDRTVEICRKFGCKISQRKFSGFGTQRQFATSLTTHSYVLAIDADEVLSPALQASLKKLKEEGLEHRIYSMPRPNFYCGQPIKHCGWYPDYQIRLFDKRYSNWNLHGFKERVVFPDTLTPQQLDGDILHYRCSTPEEYSNVQRRHAAVAAYDIKARNARINFLTPFIKGAEAFFDMYLGHGAILDGREGRAISRERFRSTYMAYNLARRSHRKQSSNKPTQ